MDVRHSVSHIWMSHVAYVDEPTALQHTATQTMGWLRLVGSLKLQVSLAKETYKTDYILQKRPVILRSLLIVATPYCEWLPFSSTWAERLYTYIIICMCMIYVYVYIYVYVLYNNMYVYHFCICVYVCIYICIHIRSYVHAHVSICMCIISVYVYMYVYIYVYIYVHMYTHMCLYVCVSFLYMCVYLYIHMYTYTFICTHTYVNLTPAHVQWNLRTTLRECRAQIHILYIYIYVYIYIYIHIHIHICIYTYVYMYICIKPFVSTLQLHVRRQIWGPRFEGGKHRTYVRFSYIDFQPLFRREG